MPTRNGGQKGLRAREPHRAPLGFSSSGERTRYPWGAREGPGPHQSSVLLAIIGLGAQSPHRDWGQSRFQRPSRLHVRQDPSGLFPYREHLSFQWPSWPHLKQILSWRDSGSDPGFLDPVPAKGFCKGGGAGVRAAANNCAFRCCP